MIGLAERGERLGGNLRGRLGHAVAGKHRPTEIACGLPGGHVEGFFDTFAAHFRAVYADVVAGATSSRPGYPTFADGHDEMLVGDAIAESARTGRWVEVVRSAPTGAQAGSTEGSPR